MLTNKHYQSYLNKDGNVRYKEFEGDVYLVNANQSPYYCDYSASYYKFDTFEEAMDKAIELVRKGVLPNYGISKNVGKYGDKDKTISILKRPLGDVIGYHYAKYIEENKDNALTPKYKKDDIVYLTCIEDGNIIYKTKIIDCELDENNNWMYYTSYWSNYPYYEHQVVSKEEFMKHYEKCNSNVSYCYYFGQRRKIVEI